MCNCMEIMWLVVMWFDLRQYWGFVTRDEEKLGLEALTGENTGKLRKIRQTIRMIS